MFDRLLGLPNVTCCYIGEKVRRGKATGRLAVVCGVRQHVDARDLEEEERIPRVVAWGSVAYPGRFPTDVRHVTPYFKATVAGPGDAITKPLPGTVGIALSHPGFGEVVTSAGHVFASPTWSGVRVFSFDEQPAVTLKDIPGGSVFRGRLLKLSITDTTDYALVRPDPPIEVHNWARGSQVLGAPYIPQPADVLQHAPLWVLTAHGDVQTTIVGIKAQVTIGAHVLRDALLTKRCTIGGDSGSPLVDEASRPWGLLVGFSAQHSVFMPAITPIIAEQAEYD